MTKKTPKIAIVGRPNVGKSSLFNRISKKRKAIVDEAEGITRDRLYHRVELFGAIFDIIDTGGIDLLSKEPTVAEIRMQAEIAISEADSIIMVVDHTTGPTMLDFLVAKTVLSTKKPVILAVNKVDQRQNENAIYDFSRLGILKMFPISCTHGHHVAELFEEAIRPIPLTEEVEVEQPYANIAIVGRPNVGKSQLLNTLLGENRSIVSPKAGTTRDSIDTLLTRGDNLYRFIDTAGIRRKHKEKEVVEKFASIRTQETIKNADICLLMIDAVEGITTEERKILREIEETEKACILLINKWDLMEDVRMEHFIKDLRDKHSFLAHYPSLCISAKTARNIGKVFQEIDALFEIYSKRIPTHALNKCLMKAIEHYHPPRITGKRLRIYYLTQIRTKPPHFVLFINSPRLLTATYRRYIVNTLRQTFEFQGVPIKLTLRGKEERKGERRPPGKHRDKDLQDIIHYAEEEEDETYLETTFELVPD